MRKTAFTLLTLLTLLCAALFIAGCSKNYQTPVHAGAGAISQTADPIEDLNQKLFAAADVSPDRGDYLLGPGDLLEVKVFEAEKLNTTVRISSRGEVSLPLLGQIEIKDLTAAEAENFIEAEYRKAYIKDPHVSIFIKEHYSQRVTVIGQVKSPGSYDYPSKQRLLDALALAGGLTDKAGTIVQIRRLSTMNHGDSQTFIVDLDKLVNQGEAELNLGINGGDVIFVPEAGTFYIDGAIRKPGEYHIKETLTLQEAIFVAGGFQPFANPEDLILMRPNGNGEREEIKINLEDRKGSAGFILQDGDIILVNAGFWGKLFYGTGLNIGIPGFGVNYRNPSR